MRVLLDGCVPRCLAKALAEHEVQTVPKMGWGNIVHTYLLHWLFAFFSRKLPEGYLLRKEDPLTLAASEPEPDIVIVKGSFEDFKHTHPTIAELVIEIAISSLELDREKVEIYALAGIPEYWLIVPRDTIVEVYQEPAEGKYQTMRRYEKTEVIATAWGALALEKLFSLE